MADDYSWRNKTVRNVIKTKNVSNRTFTTSIRVTSFFDRMVCDICVWRTYSASVRVRI